MAPSNNWIFGTEYRLSMQAQAEAIAAASATNLWIFWFGTFRARYHWLCGESIKKNDTFPKTYISGFPTIPNSWLFELLRLEPAITDFVNMFLKERDTFQNCDFRIHKFGTRYHRFCEESIKGNKTFPQLEPEHGLSMQAQAEQEQTQADHQQPQASTSKFGNLSGIYTGKRHFPKLAAMIPHKPKFWIFFCDLGHFDTGINDFVKRL